LNGQASRKIAPQFVAQGYKTIVLPTTLPGHAAMSFNTKLQQSKQLMDAG